MARGGPRPGAGRRRKAPELKQLAGTTRADRDGPKALPGATAANAPMVAPIHLSEFAQLAFADIGRMLEEQKRSSPYFAPHVALLAQRLEQIQRWQAVLEMEGDTYESVTTAGGLKITARPEVAMLSDAMRQAQSLIGELMLNPSAALRIADNKPAEVDEFAGF